MKILAIPTTFGYSKPISGGQNRFSNIIIELKTRGHNIILLESDNVMNSKENEIAKVYCYRDLKFYKKTLSIFKDFNIHFIGKLLRVLKENKIDLIQISHPSGALIIKCLCKFTGKKILLTYDAHNVESDFVNEMFALNSNGPKLEHFLVHQYTYWLEKIVGKYFIDVITVVSDEDKRRFIEKHSINSSKIYVIPSGCRFPESELNEHDQKNIRNKLRISSEKIVIIFHGAYFHTPNKKAFEKIIYDIAPLFEKNYPNVLFLLGGSQCPKFNKKNIKSLGFIEDLHDVISIADIAIVPLTNGAGTKLKIFDYFCASIPVITTKKGIEGIDAKNGENVIIVEKIDPHFISCVEYLMKSEPERKRIGLNGFKLAKEKYDWVKIGESLEKLYLQILKDD